MTVRAFYSALGIDLRASSNREAPVRCFAQPDAHNHGDRSASCSVTPQVRGTATAAACMAAPTTLRSPPVTRRARQWTC